MSEHRNDLRDKATRSLSTRRMDRRGLMRHAGAVGLAASGLGALGASYAAAQQATPAAGEVIHSMSRDQYHQTLQEAFTFEEPKNRGGQVICSQPTDIATVNGLLTSDYPTAYVTGFVFEPLVSASPIDGQMVPGLADSWDIAADGKTYTFHLNKDAKWHDGTDVTAEDVKFTFDVALD